MKFGLSEKTYNAIKKVIKTIQNIHSNYLAQEQKEHLKIIQMCIRDR